MTDLTPLTDKILSGPADTRAEFSGTGADVRIGIEAEYQVYNPGRAYRALNIDENARLDAAAKAWGLEISHEASAQTVEIKTAAYRHADFVRLKDEFNAHYAALKGAVADAGFASRDIPLLPQVSFPELLEQIHPRERAQVFLRHFRDHDAIETARYFTSVSGFQASISYTDEAHGWDVYRRAVYLAPLLSVLSGNCPSVLTGDDGRDVPTTRNETLARRLAPFGREGGVPAAFWAADDATTFFDKLNDGVWDTKLFCYYDKTGALTYVADKGEIKSLRDLPRDLQSRANYDLAASIQWHLVSLSLLPQGEGGYKRRVELRYFDTVEPELKISITQFLSALAFDRNFGAAVDKVLADCGFECDAPSRCKDLWRDSLNDAIDKGAGKIADIRYGTSDAHGASLALARAVAPFVETYPDLAALHGVLAQARPPRHGLAFDLAVNGVDGFLAGQKNVGPKNAGLCGKAGVANWPRPHK